MRRPQLNALLAGGLIAALLAGIGFSHMMQTSSEPDLPGLVLNPPRSIPDFDLLDQDGARFTQAQASGQWHLMFFGFTHCPDVCPSTLALMRQLRSDLPDNVRDQLSFDFVSIDPQRDTPEAIKEYVAFFDKDFLGLTGNAQTIGAFADNVGIAFVKVGDGDEYSMDHATALVLLDPQTRIKAYFAAPHKLEELQRALTHLIAP